jgi:hypothetical protein
LERAQSAGETPASGAYLTFFSGAGKEKPIWIANKEKDTDVRQFFFPLYQTKTAYC